MGLFKRFTEKPTKEELNAFKWKLKCGDDPGEHWKAQEEHWEKFKYHKEAAFDLMRKIYNVKDRSSYQNYSTFSVWIWSSTGGCKESPIKHHVYMNELGDKNPNKDKTPVCLACGKELRI